MKTVSCIVLLDFGFCMQVFDINSSILIPTYYINKILASNSFLTHNCLIMALCFINLL